jgi:hypothetical protein
MREVAVVKKKPPKEASLRELVEQLSQFRDRQPGESWKKEFARKHGRGPTGVEIAYYCLQRQRQIERQLRKLIEQKAEQNDPELDELIAARDPDGECRNAIAEMHQAIFPTMPSTAQGVESKPAVKGPNRGGRPRKDAEREKVREKHAAGKPWKVIAKEMNAETGQNNSVEAYRSLLKDHTAKPSRQN